MKTKLKWKHIIPFIKEFDKLTGIFYLVFTSIAYLCSIVFFELAGDFPIIYQTYVYLFLPVMIFPFIESSTNYIFQYNWFRIIYLTVSTIVYLIVLGVTINYLSPMNDLNIWNLVRITFIIMIYGVIIPTIASFPLKLMNYTIFKPHRFYYNFNMNFLREKANENSENFLDEKPAKEYSNKNQELIYLNMNEIQLEVELKNAIAADEFEKAVTIKNILERKFR